MIRSYVLAALALILASPVPALAVRGAGDVVKADLVVEPSALVPGQAFEVAVRLRMEPGWHVYWRNPGDSGMPPSLAWDLPAGIEAGEIRWPTPERIPVSDMMNYGYAGEAVLLVPMRAGKDVGTQGASALRAKLGYLVCKEICVPGSADLSVEVPNAAVAPAATDPASEGLFARARAAMPVPSPWPTRITRDGTGLTLHVARPGLSAGDVTDAAFFPYPDTVLENASEQVLRIDAEGLHLSLTPSDPKATDVAVPGVLAFDEGGVRRGFAVGEGTSAPVPGPSAPAEEEAVTLWGAIGLAFIGGLLLNLMPCVFPVLSIKVMGLVRHAGDSPGRLRGHGAAYTAGVMASFLALAGLLMVLKAGGSGLGWGFQLQSPVVVAALAYGLLAMGLSLSGVFHVGTRISGLGDGLTRRGGYQGSFFTGVLATVVATPCTAPFMGGAVGFALTQAPAVGLAVFASLGLGLALPFLLLTLRPTALRRLPRPGAWMDTLKGALAFPVYATVAWLVWVLSQQVGPEGLLAALSGLVLVGAAAWTWERAATAAPAGVRIVRGLALGLLLGSAGLVAAAGRDAGHAGRTDLPDDVVPFTQAKLDALRAEGRTVLVDLTAAWCITCQVNERAVLGREGMRAAFRAAGVTVMRGDWTNGNPEITRLLERHGRAGVPLYLLHAGAREAVVLPQILTESIVREALSGLPAAGHASLAPGVDR